MKKIALFILLVSCSGRLLAQSEEIHFQQYVLKMNKIDSVFRFDYSTADGDEETVLTYLGKVKTKQGKVYKILTSYRIWGMSKRATSRILIFDPKNKYVGNYYMTSISDLPEKICNNELVFKNTEDCDSKIVNRVDFTNGIPEEIYLRCDSKRGDTYTFSCSK